MLIEFVVLLFVVSQGAYGLINLTSVALLFSRPARTVTATTPETFEPLHVLLPARGETRAILEETLEHIAAADYPSDLITVYLIYEADDTVVAAYVEDLDVVPVPVTTDDDVWRQITGSPTARSPMDPRKGRALTYALYTLDIEGIITVLDADTIVPPDLFRRGVAGLAEYDIVQAKQTVRNVDDGILPLWESMGIAGWCHSVYAKTARGPYQLLGKGYFIRSETLRSLEGWDPVDPTEDMALGMAAYCAGYRLGVIDAYVQDLCPPRFEDWVRQKRRWVGGPVRALRGSSLRRRETARFLSFTGVNQLLSLNHVVGVPAGLAMVTLLAVGSAPGFPPWLVALVAFNVAVWLYVIVLTYSATRKAVGLTGWRQRVRYYLLSNPLTQVAYATLWVIPLVLFWFGDRTARDTFVVTPKEVPRSREPNDPSQDVAVSGSDSE